jgi:hypothetical protein
MDDRLAETICDAVDLPRELIRLIFDYGAFRPHIWQDLDDPTAVRPARRIGRQTLTDLQGSSDCSCCYSGMFVSQSPFSTADDEFDIECFRGDDKDDENCVEIGIKSGDEIHPFMLMQVGQRGWFRVDLIKNRIVATVSPVGQFELLTETAAVPLDSGILFVSVFGAKKAIVRSGPSADRPADSSEVVVFAGASS